MKTLRDAAGIPENEQVHVVNNNNGERLVDVCYQRSGYWHTSPVLGAAARKAHR
ncbi:MAG: aspartate 1-decarboxylase [Spirosomataceae bacterium]